MTVEARSFPPIAAPGARCLILGSMPGQASLNAQQYYAHPRNGFWPILAEHLGIDPTAPYATRTAALEQAGIAVWDVLAACRRPGSLDADIEPDSIVPNDFCRFFGVYRQIVAVGFNGSAAEQCFRRHVLPGLAPEIAGRLKLHRLPSTSPAHAARSLADKRAVWHAFLDDCA